MSDNQRNARQPIWFWAVASMGLLWNVFGVVQFWGTLNATADSLREQGMTPEQAALYSSLPVWMNVSFAIGVFGGVLGCILLLARSRYSKPVFLLSLAAYGILFVGDITQGVFAAFGVKQVMVLSTVVAIATLLAWVSTERARSGALK